jgi:predicted nuclease of restriction endonuclease-like (RecB) superfamily
MNFSQLVVQIEKVHTEVQSYAVNQVSIALTVRNSIIGFYIVEYEQNGLDRAEYGAKTIHTLSKKLKHLKGFSAPQLYKIRDFYMTYPQILSALTIIFQNADNQLHRILSALPINSDVKISKYENDSLSLEPHILITKLSFTHFLELIRLKDALKRNFYEIQSVKNNWGARELGRAINTMLFERMGLSKDKNSVLANLKEDRTSISEIVKNPYFLEFMGLEEKSSYSESDLETAIINNLQLFLTEMGRGFCFEARQKRLSFNNKHYRIDLVFYHRILKCHVLIDLKIGSFDHADAGQMNMYLNYFFSNEMTEGDNPPVGIILCADKDDSLVEYATAGLSNEIFVSKYLLALPSKAELELFISRELKILKGEEK